MREDEIRDYCEGCGSVRDFNYLRTDIESTNHIQRERRLYECSFCKTLKVKFKIRPPRPESDLTKFNGENNE